MRIFTWTRNSSQSPKRRAPVISSPFDFQHKQHDGPDGEMIQPIAAPIGFQHVQHASVDIEVAKLVSAQIGFQQHPSVGAGMNQPSSPLLGFQHEQHGNLSEEMRSISQVINTRAPAMPPSGGDSNSFISNPATRAPSDTKAPTQFDNTMKKLLNRKTRIHTGMTPSITVPSPNTLRSVFSAPELRDSDIPQNIARLRPVSSGQADSGSRTSRRRSWFTVTNEIIEGRRTLVRKVLDTLGCTKADRFNIYEFEPVKPPAHTVVQAFRSTEREFSPVPRRPSSPSWSKTRVAPNNLTCCPACQLL